MMSEWINIKDRAPENEGRVLVFVGNKVDVDYYDGSCEQEPWSVYIKKYVTHWMPLPEPPK